MSEKEKIPRLVDVSVQLGEQGEIRIDTPLQELLNIGPGDHIHFHVHEEGTVTVTGWRHPNNPYRQRQPAAPESSTTLDPAGLTQVSLFSEIAPPSTKQRKPRRRS